MTAEQTTADGPVAGWYPDPLAQADLRWYDGATWTDQTRANPSTEGAATAGDAPAGAAGADAGGDAAAAEAAGDDEELDADILALIAAEQRRRRIIVAAAIVLLLVAGWFFLIRGGDDSGSGDAPLVLQGDKPPADGVKSPDGTATTPDDEDPTTLADEQNRIAAQDSVTQLVAAMTSCAANGTDGSYKGCDAKRVGTLQPALKPQLAKCGTPGGACIKLIGTDGYQVSVTDMNSPPRTWTEIHTVGDAITRTCEPAGCTETGNWDPEDR